jgi:S-DNA-T family DNA segregation ATPase FtsK/SpoIIIE
MIYLRFLVILLRFFSKILALFGCFFSFFLFLSLLTFDINDSSFNSYSSKSEINNLMGIWGSYASDLMFQFIGLSAFLLSIIIFSLSVKIYRRKNNNFWLKIFLIPFCLLAFSTFFASFPSPEWWSFSSLGGVNGDFLIAKFSNFYKPLTAILSLFFALLTISVILEIKTSDWIYFIRYNFILFCFLSRKLKEFFCYLIEKFVKNNQESGEKTLLNQQKNQIIDQNQEDQSGKDSIDEIEVDEIEVDENFDLENKENLKKRLKSLKFKKEKSTTFPYYQIPQANLLIDRSNENKDKKISKELVAQQAEMLMKVLNDFGIFGTHLGAKVGPLVTLHEFEPAAGTKASRIIGLSEDIARSMSAISARIAVIAGQTSLGIELPNPKREMIFLREMIENNKFKMSEFSLPVILGKDISGETMIADLAKMPHLLIAGTTGSGKSVGLNVLILSLLFRLRPDECKFIMIDPKMLELSIYDGIPHLLSPVVTEPAKAIISLKWVVAEMEERYRLMSSMAVRNISGYNEKVEKAIISGEKMTKKVQTGFEAETGKPIIEEIEFEAKKLPFIVVIVDEMADLMMVAGKEIENSVQRLAQMARAAGIHIIMATQRPSVDVITGVIKANFPTRISFQVTSRIDSRTILGTQGAEQLLGQGDMIYMSGGAKMTRIHGPFCSDAEIEGIVNFIKNQDLSEFENDDKISFENQLASIEKNSSAVNLDQTSEEGSDNDLYQKAVQIVVRDKKPSISYVQRQLRIGYNRAAILIERMEAEGVISAPNISGKREIIENS